MKKAVLELKDKMLLHKQQHVSNYNLLFDKQLRRKSSIILDFLLDELESIIKFIYSSIVRVERFKILATSLGDTPVAR